MKDLKSTSSRPYIYIILACLLTLNSSLSIRQIIDTYNAEEREPPLEIIRARSDKPLHKGDTIHLAANVSGVYWDTSDSTVATVDSNGVVTIIGENDSCSIIAKHFFYEDIFTIQLEPIQSIRLIPPQKPLKKGSTVQIKADIEPKNATNQELEWSSSDTSVATVHNKTGVVYIKDDRKSRITITAKATDGSGKEGYINLPIQEKLRDPRLRYSEPHDYVEDFDLLGYAKYTGALLRGKPYFPYGSLTIIKPNQIITDRKVSEGDIIEIKGYGYNHEGWGFLKSDGKRIEFSPK